MARRLYLITGAPGSGKSTLLRLLPEVTDQFQIVPKVTTRRRRKDDGPEIRSIEHTNSAVIPGTHSLAEFVASHQLVYKYDYATSTLSVQGPLPHEELKAIKKAVIDEIDGEKRPDILRAIEALARRANSFPSKYDLIYEQYNVRYGLASSDLISLLCRGISPVAIVNDIRILRDIKAVFGQQACCIYIYAPLQAHELAALQTARGAVNASGGIDFEQTMRRTEKAKVILRRYIENIEVFDHVIINGRQTPTELAHQARGIMNAAADSFHELVVTEDLAE